MEIIQSYFDQFGTIGFAFFKPFWFIVFLLFACVVFSLLVLKEKQKLIAVIPFAALCLLLQQTSLLYVITEPQREELLLKLNDPKITDCMKGETENSLRMFTICYKMSKQ